MESSPTSALHDRGARAQRIIAKADGYKVCEGCDSIVSVRVAICPNCFGYRFDEERAAVIAQAELLATREQTSVTAADLV